MAENFQRAYGLKPIDRHHGGTESRAKVYAIPKNYAEDLVPGDMVKHGGGAVQDGKVNTILLYEQGDAAPILGVIIGFSIDNPSDGSHGFFIDSAQGAKQYYPKNTNEQWYVHVIDDPDCVFKARLNTAAVLAADKQGMNIDVSARTPELNAYPVPGYGLDAGTAATTTDLPLKLLQARQEIFNEPLQAYAEFEVKINRHHFRTQTAGA